MHLHQHQYLHCWCSSCTRPTPTPDWIDRRARSRAAAVPVTNKAWSASWTTRPGTNKASGRYGAGARMHMFRVCAVGVGGPRSIGAAVRAVPLPSSSSRMIIRLLALLFISFKRRLGVIASYSK